MKKQRTLSLLIRITLVFFGFTLGFFLGRNTVESQVQLQLSSSIHSTPTGQTAPAEETTEGEQGYSFPIDINTAEKEELMALPGIGEVLAERILTYRENHGPFSSAKELLYVQGIGQDTLNSLLALITIGGSS